jgi:type I restriction enzyme M protein
MRHFATESGKSKGQFYTPSEVSQIIAKIVGIREAKTSAQTTIYDPTCGSGSLLLKVADEASSDVTVYGQEKDATTSGLARMNMILHQQPTAEIVQGNTLADPKFKDRDHLKLFDYVVANPPFSDKRWSNGINPTNDPFGRFSAFGFPPNKQGDYAYLLHIVASLKSTGTGACILPHGVLFRGGSEAQIRENLIRKGYIIGIVGLPANLFYGTGIPACIVVIGKQNAQDRVGVFMIDASSGFMKDGAKNRLRAQDIHKIVDVFTRRLEVPKYSRMVPFSELEKNGFNLNMPRYIDSQFSEDIQDIAGHLQGGIPAVDIDTLERYWKVCPDLRKALFKVNRPGYVDLTVDKLAIKATIQQHPQFRKFVAEMNVHFATWSDKTATLLKGLTPGFHPKDLIKEISENLLTHYADNPLIDAYTVYQHLMDYWAETMQDDCYLVSSDGWRAEPSRIIVADKKGKEKDKGWACELIPKPLIVARYFAKEQTAIDDMDTVLESIKVKFAEMLDQHGTEGGALDFDTLRRDEVSARLKEIAADNDMRDEAAILESWLQLNGEEASLKTRLRNAEADLDTNAYKKYATLSKDDIKALVVEDKWIRAIGSGIHEDLDRISESFAMHIRTLADRYQERLAEITERIETLEHSVEQSLRRMGFAWN